METRVAVVTVRVLLPEILPYVAMIVAEPRAIDLASPLLTVATDASDETHVTDVVRSFFVLSE